MRPCSTCSRPLLPLTDACPFCGVKMTSKWMALAGTAVLTPLVLSACYGQPPCNESADADGDGFETCLDGGAINGPEDCNDADETINPGATEICDDGIDNDCDFQTDEEDLDCDSGSDTDNGSDTEGDSGSGM